MFLQGSHPGPLGHAWSVPLHRPGRPRHRGSEREGPSGPGPERRAHAIGTMPTGWPQTEGGLEGGRRSLERQRGQECPLQVEETVCHSGPGPERRGAAQGTQHPRKTPSLRALCQPALLAPVSCRPLTLALPGAHLWCGRGTGEPPTVALSLLLSVMGQRLAGRSWRPGWWPHGSARGKHGP